MTRILLAAATVANLFASPALAQSPDSGSRTIVETPYVQAAAHQRAGVVGSIYLVSYLTFGVPVIIAGQLASPFGLVPTVFWYSSITVLLALIGLRAQRKLSRQSPSASPAPAVVTAR